VGLPLAICSDEHVEWLTVSWTATLLVVQSTQCLRSQQVPFLDGQF
jgi:hypothetical protein